MPSFMQMPQTPLSEGLRTGQTEWMPPLVVIEEDAPLSEVIRDLSQLVPFASRAVTIMCHVSLRTLDR